MANLTLDEKQDLLLDLIDRFEENAEDLKTLGFLNDADTTEDIMRNLSCHLAIVNAKLQRERERDIGALSREYLASVL